MHRAPTTSSPFSSDSSTRYFRSDVMSDRGESHPRPRRAHAEKPSARTLPQFRAQLVACCHEGGLTVGGASELARCILTRLNGQVKTGIQLDSDLTNKDRLAEAVFELSTAAPKCLTGVRFHQNCHPSANGGNTWRQLSFAVAMLLPLAYLFACVRQWQPIVNEREAQFPVPHFECLPSGARRICRRSPD